VIAHLASFSCDFKALCVIPAWQASRESSAMPSSADPPLSKECILGSLTESIRARLMESIPLFVHLWMIICELSSVAGESREQCHAVLGRPARSLRIQSQLI
jgi:hypothetical protein